ncbi:hypothetical protein GF312_08840 [Candidatus Poribacteria bacterium]|nr:hypothetical protein [Candidatus Poribacteria bacterium]
MLLIGCLTVFVSSMTGSISDENIFELGMCTHFSQGKGIVESNIYSMKMAGISSIRDESTWKDVERTKDVLEISERIDRYIDHANKEGIGVMMILDYSNPFYDDGDRPKSPEAVEGFCRYSEHIVKHFGDKIKWYEIWNEWDIPIGLPPKHQEKNGERNRGKAEDYFNLLKAVYPRIKSANPDAIVLGGCPTPGAVRNGWLEKIMKLGAVDYCDAISIHTYNYSAKGFDRTPEAWQAWMLEVQAMLRKYNNDNDPDFYVTEMGWPTHVDERGTSPELSASYLARLYLLARTMPSFEGLWWYDFQDDGWKAEYNENNFGIIRPDLTPKPAYYVTWDISELVKHGEYLGRMKTSDENLWLLQFKLDGDNIWAVWSGDDQERQVIFETKDTGIDLSVLQTGHKHMDMKWGHRDWVDNRGQPLMKSRMSLTVGHRPYILKGGLGNISVVDIIPRPR